MNSSWTWVSRSLQVNNGVQTGTNEKRACWEVLAHECTCSHYVRLISRSERSEIATATTIAIAPPAIKSIASFVRKGGGYGPDPVHVGPPRTTVRQLTGCWSCVRIVQLSVRLVFAVLFASCVGCESGHLSPFGPAKCRAQLSGVRVTCLT